jgi:hypothetical protein
MFGKFLKSSVAALVLGSSLAAVPALAGPVHAPHQGTAMALTQTVRFGPFATLRRANEVANYWRNQGYNAQVIYLGTVDYREYAVDVWDDEKQAGRR